MSCALLRLLTAKTKSITIARNIIVWMIKHTTKLVVLVLEIVVLKYKCITKFLFTTKTEILCDMRVENHFFGLWLFLEFFFYF